MNPVSRAEVTGSPERLVKGVKRLYREVQGEKRR
jgi:hypothetical protein